METVVQNFGPIEFTTVDKVDRPEKYLLFVAEILNRHGVRWFLSFGTALGFYRENDFIQSDTDIDINVLDASQKKIADIIWEIENKYDCVRSVTRDEKQMQVAFQDFLNNFVIDICFFYANDVGYYSYCEGGMWQDRKEIIGDLKLFKTKYGEFPMPSRIEDYLVDRYGDWKTPRYGEISSSIKV